MKHKRRLALLMAVLMTIALLPAVKLSSAVAEDAAEISLDFTSNTWGLPTDYSTETASYTDTETGYTITLAAGNGYKFAGNYLIFGKTDASLTLPAFDFDVEKIVVNGNSGASAKTLMNVFVGDTAVSTETTGCTGTNTYAIAEDNQAAGNIYTLKVNNNYNAQVTKIEIYKKGGDTPVTPTPTSEPETTDMKLNRVPENGETVVIYYPKTSKVMTGTDYFYNNEKHELVAADATLTDNILAVPEEALRLTVSVADNKYTFKTADDKYLYADGTDVLLVSEQGANTLFQLETAAAGVDNYYIKCDSACYNNDPEKPQYIEFYGGHFTVYSLYTDNAAIYTFQFFSEDGEGPTPEAQYTVTLNPGEAAGDPVTIENVTSPYHLPGCPETFTLEGKLFDGWKVNGEGETLAVGATIALSGDTTLAAQWKDAPVSETKSYALVTDASELAEGDKIILVGENEGALYALSYQKTNNRHAVVVTADEQNVIAAAIATGTDDKINVYELVLGGNAADGWTFYDPLFGYLYAAASDANYLKSEATADENAKFTLDIDASGLVNPVAANSTNRNQMRFNYNSGTPLFSCYKEESTFPGVYIYKLVEDTPEPTQPSFRGPQLSLGGQIGVIFNMYLPAGMDFTGSYMTFSIPHGNCTEEEAYNGSDSFTCYINAIQMAEPITATFHYGDNQTIEKTFAAMEYFGAFDKAVSAGTITPDAKTVTLVHALADYGHYVQLFLSEKNGWELGTDYAAMDVSYKTAFDSYDVSDYAISCPDVKTLFSKVSFSLVLDSETAIRLFLTPKEGVGDITVTCSDGKTANVTRTGSRCLVEIPNISAHQLAKTYTLTVSAGDQSVTIKVSALSYVQLMLNAYADDTNALNAAAAIYYYAMAAKAFKEN